MPAIQLTPAQRKVANAPMPTTSIRSVVGSGAHAGRRREVDAALKAHGLIKVRVFSDDRAKAREQILAGAGRRTRRRADPAHRQAAGAVAAAAQEKAEREDRPGRGGEGPEFSKSGNHRPQVKKVKVSATSAWRPAARSSAPEAASPASRRSRSSGRGAATPVPARRPLSQNAGRRVQRGEGHEALPGARRRHHRQQREVARHGAEQRTQRQHHACR